MKYKAKVDKWISLTIYFVIITTWIPIISIPSPEVIYYAGFAVLFSVFMLWILISAYYELTQDHVYCKIGPFFSRIYYDKIKSVKKTDSLLSSMALSRKRIEIKVHNKGFILGTTHISPINRDQFIYELEKRCPNLEK